MIVQLFKPPLAYAVVLLTGTVAHSFAAESSPEQWKQAFPLSTLQGTSGEPLPAKPDLARSLSFRETGASPAQLDPLNKTAKIRFGPDVATIGDAARKILEPVGYELLTNGPNVSSLLEELLDSPLPVNQREFVHLRVSEMLRALAGVGHVVVFDHVHRKATFDPIPRYNRIGQSTRRDAGRATGRADNGLSSRLRSNIIVTPLGEPALQEQRPEQSVVESDTWQMIGGVDSAIDGDDFTQQINRALQGNEFSRPLANTSVSKFRDQHIVLAEVDATRLAAETERTLRLIASRFNVDKHDVVISDCSGDVSASSQALQQKLIRSALIRLGVDEDRHQTMPCSDSGASIVSNGKITHVVMLSIASS